MSIVLAGVWGGGCVLELKLQTCILVVHLIGLGLGVGGALITDGYVVRNAILTKIKPGVEDTVSFLASIVTVGLVLLWVSGIALAAQMMMTTPNFINNEKFWAKVAIVAILTVNGVSIHQNVLPLLRKQQGRRLFDGLDRELRLFLAASGSISGVSWILPVLLGSAKEMSYITPFTHIMAFYCCALIAMTAIAIVAIERVLPQLSAEARPDVSETQVPAARRRTMHDLAAEYDAAWPSRRSSPIAPLVSAVPQGRLAAAVRKSASPVEAAARLPIAPTAKAFRDRPASDRPPFDRPPRYRVSNSKAPDRPTAPRAQPAIVAVPTRPVRIVSAANGTLAA